MMRDVNDRTEGGVGWLELGRGKFHDDMDTHSFYSGRFAGLRRPIQRNHPTMGNLQETAPDGTEWEFAQVPARYGYPGTRRDVRTLPAHRGALQGFVPFPLVVMLDCVRYATE